MLRHHIRKYEQQDPEFVQQLIGGFFVDDLLTSCSGWEAALDLYEKARMRMKEGEGGLTLRKWKTNDKVLANEISEREKKKDVESTSETSDVKNTTGKGERTEPKPKVLGITWDNEADTLEFDLGKIGKDIGDAPQATKRSILSTLASLFDPHGIVSPIAVVAKILFQELCVLKLGWDDSLPAELCVRWETSLRNSKETNKIYIPRCVLDYNKEDVLSV